MPASFPASLVSKQISAISRVVWSLCVVSVDPISIPGSGPCVVSSVSCLESLMSGTWSVASRGRGRDHCPLREETTPVLQISSLSLKHQPLLLFKTSKNVSGKHDLNQIEVEVKYLHHIPRVCLQSPQDWWRWFQLELAL